jgi:hypothetical protein
MPEFISADHIAAQNGAFEPQRKNNFTLVIAIDQNRLLQRSLDSFPLPKEANEEVAVNYANEVRKVAGRAVFENLELVLKDFADQGIGQLLIAWRRQVYDPSNGKIGLAKDYKKSGEVVMFAPDGTLQRTWTLIGCWPSKLDPGGGDMNANENNKISCTLTIDKAIPGKAGSKSSSSSGQQFGGNTARGSLVGQGSILA